MIHQTIRLNDIFDFLPRSSAFIEPTLTTYCPDNSREIDPNRRRASVLICPGGGYIMVSDREAEPVALQFVARGFNAFVLRYSVAPARYPVSLLQLAAAIVYIRQNAEHYHADAKKIAVCGFSAGGHLAASLGTFWNTPVVQEPFGHAEKPEALRPDALILGYPVITAGKFSDKDSFSNLTGGELSPEAGEKLSLEKQVNGDVPPAFLWHTFEDDAVPVENTLLFASALREHSIPFELHIFPKGPHGLAVATEETGLSPQLKDIHVAGWIDLCGEWLKVIFKTVF